MTQTVITVPASFEQGEEITEYFLKKRPLVILPTERAMLLRTARQQHPGCKIISAELDVETGNWSVTVTT